MAGFSLDAADRAHGGVSTLLGHASTDIRDGAVGFQADAAGAVSLDGDDGYAGLAARPYLRVAPNVFAGLYGAVGLESGASYTLGTEFAYAPARGFGVDLFFSDTGGSQFDEGHVTNKSVDLFRTTPSGARYGIEGRKETLNRPGTSDSDFYAYGLHAEIPFRTQDRAMFTASLGQIRYDARDETYGEASIGLQWLLGPVPRRPTFGYRHGVLPGLIHNIH
ncbi:hypothetical protein [Tropicimonas isoalkanivorans]|nr:hypothetical protein [Tropicimonas isoalkanivorans]